MTHDEMLKRLHKVAQDFFRPFNMDVTPPYQAVGQPTVSVVTVSWPADGHLFGFAGGICATLAVQDHEKEKSYAAFDEMVKCRCIAVRQSILEKLRNFYINVQQAGNRYPEAQ